MDTKEYVIDILKSYKKLIALKNELIYDFDGYISALRIDGMPKATEKSDPIQTAIRKQRAEIRDVKREIKRIENWMEYLDDRERHYLTEVYINNRFRLHAQNSWTSKHNEYISRRSWGNIRHSALKKLTELILSKKK